MELALLIYGISLLPQISSALSFLSYSLFFGAIISSVVWLIASDERNLGESEKQKARNCVATCGSWIKRSITWFLIVGAISIAIPSEKTAYMMAGSYAAQTVAQSEAMGKVITESGKISSKILDIINNKLDGYVEETMQKAEKAISTDNKETKA